MSTEYTGRSAFGEFATEAADGQFMADVSRDFVGLAKTLHEQALAQNSKAKGKLTLELNLTTDERGEVDFTYAIKVKNPAKPTARGRLWMGKNGMTAVHPRQLELVGAERARRGAPPPETGRRAPEEPRFTEADDGNDEDGSL